MWLIKIVIFLLIVVGLTAYFTDVDPKRAAINIGNDIKDVVVSVRKHEVDVNEVKVDKSSEEK